MQLPLVGRTEVLGALEAECIDGRGVVVAGPAGIGKTRLLAEFDGLGWNTRRFRAHRSTRSIPFGPFLSILAGERPQRIEDRLASLVRELGGNASDEHRCIVMIDDAHLLDESSLAVVLHLVRERNAAVVLSVRSGEPMPADLLGVWTDGSLRRIDLKPLERDAVAELVGAAVGGTTSASLVDRLVRDAGGNPLLVRELLLDGLDNGGIVVHDGCAELVELRPGPRVVDLVSARVAATSPEARRLMDMVAVAETLDLQCLAGRRGRALEELERTLLVAIETDAAGPFVRADHPLVAETIQAALPVSRHLEVCSLLADAVTEQGFPRPGDALRVVGWRSECNEEIDPAVAAPAAYEALMTGDLVLAERLARLWGDSTGALLVLAEVHRLRSEPDEALAVLARAAADAHDDETIGRIALLRSMLLAHHLGRPADAITELHRSADLIQHSTRALELEAEASYLSGLSGRFDLTVETSGRILRREDLDSAAEWTALINVIYGKVMLADVASVHADLDRAEVLIDVVEEGRPEARDLLTSLRLGAMELDGSFPAGASVIAALAAENTVRAFSGLSMAIGGQLLMLHDAHRALWASSLAIEILTEADPFGALPLALGSAAQIHALAGRRRDAERMLSALPDDLTDVRALPFVARARAELLARSGQHRAAAELVGEEGRSAAATTHVTFGALALHDAVRHGHPGLVHHDLREAADGSTSELLDLLAEHARGANEGDHHVLAACARRFTELGAVLLGAECWAALAAIADGHAAPRAAARAALLAREVAPFTTSADHLSGGLTSRELDVAQLAASGSTSREVADQLYVSVRTVDNHLRHVYAKLGLGNRAELGDVLGTSCP